jgi:hypothetical protein
MQLYFAQGNTDKALATLQRQIELGKADSGPMTVALAGLRDAGLAHDAVNLYLQHKDKIRSKSALLNAQTACVQAGTLDAGRLVYAAAIQTPDVTAEERLRCESNYLQLLFVCGQYEEADQLFVKMAHDEEADIVTYNIAIVGYGMLQKIDKVLIFCLLVIAVGCLFSGHCCMCFIWIGESCVHRAAEERAQAFRLNLVRPTQFVCSQRLRRRSTSADGSHAARL